MASLLRDTFDARQVAGDSSTNNKPWHCQACLFLNKGDRNTCAVCKRKRQKDDKPGYYHGNISREEACTILSSKDTGSFLFRELTPNRMILCVKHQRGVTSCSLFVDANGQIFLGSKWNFESIESLVRYFSTNDGLLTKLTHPVIRKAHERDLFPWEIKLSEIDVKYRIGKQILNS
ncbi:Hypothetical predicted protein [Mytilus galloprovincialis]|uniref:RanBP2-type domain-containing protein n=1 Tax=Mytilus galloprovincialis TaxID=29158 RepID=A0A8B6C352_MYTGA|nr:Hypothetical predicted protein [Mytilus galloprovincialis]